MLLHNRLRPKVLRLIDANQLSGVMVMNNKLKGLWKLIGQGWPWLGCWA